MLNDPVEMLDDPSRKAKRNVERFTRDFGQKGSLLERLAKNVGLCSLDVEPSGDEESENVGHSGKRIHKCRAFLLYVEQ